jgi:hypothetical protein
VNQSNKQLQHDTKDKAEKNRTTQSNHVSNLVFYNDLSNKHPKKTHTESMIEPANNRSEIFEKLKKCQTPEPFTDNKAKYSFNGFDGSIDDLNFGKKRIYFEDSIAEKSAISSNLNKTNSQRNSSFRRLFMPTANH